MAAEQAFDVVDRPADATLALLSLLSHDLREPLGPIELALSLMTERLPPEDAELAHFAEAHCKRLLRLIDAVLWSMRTPGAVNLEQADLAEITRAAANTARVLGVASIVDAESCPVKASPAAMQGGITGLLECVPDGTTVDVLVRPDGARALLILRADRVRWAAALESKTSPHDRESAFVQGAAAIFRAHDGGLEACDGALTGWLPLRT